MTGIGYFGCRYRGLLVFLEAGQIVVIAVWRFARSLAVVVTYAVRLDPDQQSRLTERST
jgi:hypothetical protein